MLTHDTKKALKQTMGGQIAVCQYLFEKGFKYVPLRHLQSDRIEGEFAVYRQSTGANMFMISSDVFNAFKSRLTKMAATLESLDVVCVSSGSHHCRGMEFEDAAAIEAFIEDATLTSEEEIACAYVAGWLEFKCNDLQFDEDEYTISGESAEFILEVSRASLTIPHIVTVDFVKAGLRFVNQARAKACCSNKLVSILQSLSDHFCFGFTSKSLMRKLSNVLLRGLHNLEKDNPKDALIQTSVKQGRMAD